MAVEGVFIDIFGRMNMASFAKVFSEVNAMAKEEGAKTSRSFAEGFDTMKAQYTGLVEVANDAYRDMELGLSNLRVAEARINELRAENFKRSSDEMIAAQKEVNAAIAEQAKLTDAAMASRDRAALATPIGRTRGREDESDGRRVESDDRGRRVTPIPMSRAGTALGFGAFAATALGGFEATRESARMQDQLNKLVTQSQESRANIPGIEQAILQIANQTGQDPQELGKASLLAEKRGYRGGPGGGDLATMLRVASQLGTLENVNLDDAVKALSITSTNFHKSPDQLADVASQLNRAVGRSGTTLQGFASALPNFETVAGISGLQNEDVWATLATLTRAGFEPERAGMNEASMIRSLSGQAGAPAQNMLNQLLTKANSGETAGDIYNQFGKRGIGGTIDEVFNKAILPNLTEDQKHVVLPAYFQNLQAERDTDEGVAGLKTDAAKRFAETNEQFRGGMLTPFKIRSTGKSGLGSQLLSEGATPEDIDALAQLATKFQQLHGLSNTLKNNQDDVQTIEAVLGKVFSTVEAGRGALIVHENNQQYKDTLADINAGKAETGPDGKPAVEGSSQAMDTAAAQARRLKASLKGVAITLGDEMQGPLKTVMSGLADMGDWMQTHKGVLDAFAASIAAIGTAWVGLKALKFGKGVFDEFGNAIKGVNNFFNRPSVGGPGASQVGSINESVQVAAGEKMGAAVAAGAEKGATALAEGVVAGAEKAGSILAGAEAEGARAAAPALAEGVTAGGKGAGEVIAADVTAAGGRAGAEMGDAITVAGGRAAEELSVAGGRLSNSLGGLMGPMAAMAAGMGVPKLDNALQGSNWWQQVTGGSFGDNPIGWAANHFLGAQEFLGQQAGLYNGPVTWDIPHLPVTVTHTPLPGHARGGIAGYDEGTDKVADPYSQPLMGMPDKKRDTILGLVKGRPVGLRGGEGILTPEAVAALGGKSGVDALNSGKIHLPENPNSTRTKGSFFNPAGVSGNPWDDPAGVGATFFGSFAKGFGRGMHRYKAGHILENVSQTIDSLVQQQREEEEPGKRRRGMPAEIEQMLASGMTPQEVMQALGVTQGKRGGYELPGGRYLSRTDKEELGLPTGKAGKSSWFGNEDTVHRVFSKYFPESEWGAFHNLEMHEAGFDPHAHNPSGAYGIGQFMPYTWGAYGTSGKTDDLTTQADDMMKYIKGRYGTPGGAWGQYFNHAGGEGSYSRGGIVGYDIGGVVSGGGSINPFAGLSGSVGPSKAGASIMPRPNIAPMDMPDGPRGSGTSNAFGGAKGQGQATGTGIMSPGQPGIPSRGEVGSPIAGPFSGREGTGSGPKGVVIAPPEAPPKVAPGILAAPGVGAPDMAPGAEGRKTMDNPSRQGGMGNTSKGLGIGGGLIGTAESAASMAADAFAPGSGQAANMAFQLMNRAIGFGGQLAGILGSGLLETFLPNNSPLADPTNNLFGKVVTGIAGAHPSPKNMAGESAMQLKPKEDLDQGAMAGKQVMPMVHMDHPTIHNYTNDHQETGNSIMKATFGMDIHH